MSTVLTSTQYEVDSDPVRFAELAVERGWSDGLPLVPPTIERVQGYVDASGLDPDTVVASLPPLSGEATVERIAINAVMAGAPAASMPLLIAAIAAMVDPDFELHSQNATTAPVIPALLVNGPQRHELGIPFGSGCVGGADGTSPAIGRAIRLIMRNIAGQRIGVTSQSVFGQPGRVSGIVFGEWEERSPWAPLAERRGVPGNAVTVFGAMGTMNIIAPHLFEVTADYLLKFIGQSIAYPGATSYMPGLAFSEMLIGINPIWADIIGKQYPNVTDVEDIIWDAASLPLDRWPVEYHDMLREKGNVAKNPDQAHMLKDRTDRVHVAVCGGLAGLHALALHGMGTIHAITRPVPWEPVESYGGGLS